jgi:hypothetical protein
MMCSYNPPSIGILNMKKARNNFRPADKDMFDLPPQKPDKLCPDAYIFVSTAGTAKHSDVRFCLPKSIISYIDPEVAEATSLSPLSKAAW